jgi:hypothetical protein
MHAHTTQVYFPEALNERVSTIPLYRDNSVQRTTNDHDRLFSQVKAGAGTLSVSVHM